MAKLLSSLMILAIFLGAPWSAMANSDDSSSGPDFRSSYCKKRDAVRVDLAGLKTFTGTSTLAFGINLYKQIASHQKHDANIVYSPISAYLLLAMVAAGADKDTLNELLAALHIAPKDKETFTAASGNLMALLNCPGEYSSLDLSLANGLFRQKGKPLLAPFLGTLQDQFDSKPIDVNFSTPPATVKLINDWVSEKTAGKIENLINEQAISRDTKLILVNAIHLKDGWANVFEEKATKPKDFFHLNGSKTRIPMMSRKGLMGDYEYASMGSFAAASLKTSSKDLDLIILLPGQRAGLKALEKSLDEALINKVLKTLSDRRVNLTLPKFKIASDMPLTDDFKALGLKKIFLPRIADFSRMDAGADLLYVSTVLQKAMIDVNEKGIEAAAATAAMMEAGGMPPKPTAPVDFVADHPFLYLVRHRRTNALLFMGRYM